MRTATAIWERVRFPLYTGVLAAFWILVVVMWVYMANYIYFYITGRMELAELAWKAFVPVVDLLIAVSWSFQYWIFIRQRSKQQ